MRPPEAPDVANGFVVLARKAFTTWFWGLTGNQIKIFLWLIYRARYTEGVDQWWDGSELVQVARGELITSPETIAKACGVSRNCVRNSLKLFERTGSIVAKVVANRYTHLTLTNYATYQDVTGWSGLDVGQVVAKRRPSAGHVLATEETKTNSGNQENQGNQKKAARTRRRAPRTPRLAFGDTPKPPAPPVPPTPYTQAIRYAHGTWKRLHGTEPTWTPGDYRHLSGAFDRLKQDLDAFKDAWSVYLGTSEDWLSDHSPKLFASRLDRWRVVREA